MAEVFPVRWCRLISSTDHDNCLFRPPPARRDIMRLLPGQGCPHGSGVVECLLTYHRI